MTPFTAIGACGTLVRGLSERKNETFGRLRNWVVLIDSSFVVAKLLKALKLDIAEAECPIPPLVEDFAIGTFDVRMSMATQGLCLSSCMWDCSAEKSVFKRTNYGSP